MFLLTALLLFQGPAPDSLTLDEALARSKTRGQVAADAARVATARAAYRVAGTIPNPTITYTHSESPPRQHLLVDQPLDWLLRRGQDRAAAGYGVGSAVGDSVQTAAELRGGGRGGFLRRAGASRRGEPPHRSSQSGRLGRGHWSGAATRRRHLTPRGR